MKIDQFSLAMESQHNLQQSRSIREKITTRQLPPPPPPATTPTDNVQISANGKIAAQEEDALNPELSIMRQLLESTFGMKFESISLNHEFSTDLSMSESYAIAANVDRNSNNTGQTRRIEREISYRESEAFQFSAKGQIKTADGQEISFQLDIAMARQFEIKTKETLNFGAAAKDPLMLTIGPGAGKFSGSVVSFDLDDNGSADRMPMPDNGGWLVLDNNQDDKVNSRQELFGPQSGNGFADLAKLDRDGNQAIDAGDPLFARLRLWQGRQDGKDILTPLKDLGISALLLPHSDANFRYTDENNQTIAQLRKAGVYVNANGSAGLLSQVDVSV